MSGKLPDFFEAWTRHRYLGEPRPAKPAHITKAEFPGVIAEWARFDAFMAWKDAGSHLPRPLTFWLTVPPNHWPNHPEVKLSAWTLRGLAKKPPVQHDKPPTVPTPPPPTVTLPIAFTAYGYANGEFHDGNDWRRLTEAGFKAVALQQGEGATRGDADRLRNAGIEVYAWDDLPFDANRTLNWLDEMGILPDMYIPQVESPPQLERLRQYLAAGFDIRAAVVSGSQPIPADVSAKVTTALVECYANDGYPFSDIDRMMAQFVRDGWPTVAPVLGLYDGKTVADHTNAGAHWPGGVWLLETLTADQAAILKAMA